MIIVRETHYPDYLHHFNVYIPYNNRYINLYTCMCCREPFIRFCEQLDEPDTYANANDISIRCLKHWLKFFKKKYTKCKNKPWYTLVCDELKNAIITHSKSDKCKFAEDEKVYILKDGIISKAKIRTVYYDYYGTGILYNCKANKIISRYLDYKSHIAIIPENKVFKTKEEAEQKLKEKENGISNTTINA